jgi:hypothetical protein
MSSKIPLTIATATSIGSLTFFAGQQSNRIDELFRKAHLAEAERKDSKELLYEIHGKVSAIEKDIQYLKEKAL